LRLVIKHTIDRSGKVVPVPAGRHKELQLVVDGSYVLLPEQFFVLTHGGIHGAALSDDVRKHIFKGFPSKLHYLLSPVRQHAFLFHRHHRRHRHRHGAAAAAPPPPPRRRAAAPRDIFGSPW